MYIFRIFIEMEGIFSKSIFGVPTDLRFFWKPFKNRITIDELLWPIYFYNLWQEEIFVTNLKKIVLTITITRTLLLVTTTMKW